MRPSNTKLTTEPEMGGSCRKYHAFWLPAALTASLNICLTSLASIGATMLVNRSYLFDFSCYAGKSELTNFSAGGYVHQR